MATLFNRLYAYSKNNNVPMLLPDERMALGRKIKELFRSSGIKKRYSMIQAKDFDFDGKVANYPVEFKEQIDFAIKAFYNGSDKLEMPKKRKRVINKGEKVYSSKIVVSA